MRKDQFLDRMETGYSLRATESAARGIDYLLDDNEIGLVLRPDNVAQINGHTVVRLSLENAYILSTELAEIIQLHYQRFVMTKHA